MPDQKKARAAAARRTSSKAAGKDNQSTYYVWAGIFLGSVVLACITMVISPAKSSHQVNVNDASLITHVNRNARSWTAARSSFFEGWTMRDVKALKGVDISPEASALSPCAVPNLEVPENFDARLKWPQCFLAPVYNQGNCSSSWAIAAASSMSNRYCIADPAEFSNVMLSAQQLLSCDRSNKGCQGGFVDRAFRYIKEQGLVSERCFPYQADQEVSCNAMCRDETSRRAASHCLLSDEATIRREIFLNGPVIAPMFLNDDFLVYRGGIYQELRTSTQLGSTDVRGRSRLTHAIKLLGWGRWEGRDYWVIENSWGEDWGERGFARVPRGESFDSAQRGIVLESFAVAGTPSSRKMEAKKERSDEL